MKPPANTEPSELWRDLMATPLPAEIVDYPRKGPDGKSLGKLRIRVLTPDEHDTARLRAQRWLRETRRMPKDDWDSEPVKEVLGDAMARHLLAFACEKVDPMERPDDYFGPDRYAKIFQSPEDLGKIPHYEFAKLFRLYLQVQHKFGGVEARIETAEDVEAWIETLMEGGDAYPLALLSLEDLALLSFKLACLVATLRESHSPTSPDGGDATNETSGPSTSSPGLPPSDSVDDGPPLPEPIDDEEMTIERATEFQIQRLKRDEE